MLGHSNPRNASKPVDENYPEFFYIGLFVINAVFSITASVGNFFVLGTIWKSPALHRPGNLLLSGLALSDIGVGLIIQPFFIAVLIYELEMGIENVLLWKIFRSTQAIFLYATILTLTSISVDRCLALMLHMRYVSIVTIKKTTTLLCIIWLTSVLYAMTVFISTPFYRNLSIVILALCLGVNISTCLAIYRICRRHRLQIQSQTHGQHSSAIFDLKRHRKSLITMILLLILLLVCYAPYIYLRIAVNYVNWPKPMRKFLMRYSLSLIYLNSSLNPLVYCWRMRAIRSAMKQFWRSLFLSK